MLENGMDKCTCPKTKCKLHGKCEECIAKHGARNKLPRCKREKKGFLSNRNAFYIVGFAACAAVLLFCVWMAPSLIKSPNPAIDNPSPSVIDKPSIISSNAPQHGGLADAASVMHDPVVPESRSIRLTLEEAQNDPDFGAYLPAGVSARFSFESAQRLTGQECNSLSLFWNAGHDYINWSVSNAADYDTSLIVAANEPEKYDMSLYPLPLVESVPKELWKYVNNPVFLAKELTPDVIKARACFVDNDHGDTSGCRMDFSVLYGDVVVRVDIKGASPGQVWEMFAEVMK